jgi:hypothetical protein
MPGAMSRPAWADERYRETEAAFLAQSERTRRLAEHVLAMVVEDRTGVEA